MASATGKWREEQILVVCPGSRTTMAQLGCAELTPPVHRIPTRMFKDGDEWRPYHTFLRKKIVAGVEQEDWVEDVDSDEGALYPIQGGRIVEMDAFLAFLDHVHGMLTTTYHNTPIILMASPQWTRPDCETIARYIFEKTRTPALCMIHSGLATQYGLKWPNMTVIDIGYEKVDVTAIHDGRVVNHLDLGAPTPARHISGGEVFTQSLLKLLKNKDFSYDMAEQLKKSTICEVLPYAAGVDGVVDLPVNSGPTTTSGMPLPAPVADAGVEAAPKPAADPSKAPEDGAEDDEEGEPNGDDDGVLDVAKIVTSGQTKEFLAKKEKEKGKPGRKSNKEKEAEAAAAAKPVRLPNSKRTHNTFWYEEVVQEEVKREPRIPLTVNGNVAAEKPAGDDAAAATTAMATATVADDVPKPEEGANGEAAKPVEGDVSVDAPKLGEDGKPAESSEDAAAAEARAAEARAAEAKLAEEKAAEAKAAEEKAAEVRAAEIKAAEEREAEAQALEAACANDTPEHRAKRVRRDIEVGLERFTFAERGEIDRIVSTIYRAIQGIDDMYMRPACWDNLVFVGNGARLRGLKDNILQTLNARHLVSPSTATMFTSELPSNMATPTGTGSQTPTGSFTGAPHQLSSSGVNPLLQAATTANTLGMAGGPGGAAGTPQAGSEAGGTAPSHHFHSQTPTSIKTSTLPTYLSEWTKNGFEEAMFLGAQVAGRIAFCLHTNMDTQSIEAQRLMSLSRVDYNELGPKGVRTHSMLG